MACNYRLEAVNLSGWHRTDRRRALVTAPPPRTEADKDGFGDLGPDLRSQASRARS